MGDLWTRGAVEAGYFFGANSCLNVGKGLQTEAAAFPAVDPGVVLCAFSPMTRQNGL